MNSRLTKQHRLLHAAEFSRVFSQPELRLSSPTLLILASANGGDLPRLGLVISRKNVGCAVARNRIKRLCREAFRARAGTFAGIDLVMLARSGVSRLDNGAFRAQVDKLLDQLLVKQAALPAK